jgi:Ca2+-binding RTX toxin-like protein
MSSTVAPKPTASPAVTLLKPASGMVLTVGQGMEFATLADACKAAVNGDTIAVQAGTYVNDFSIVNANVTIVAVGGMVNEVATEPPPNDKGIMTVNANLSIQGFSFTGGSDGSPDGNVAGIRLQSGNLNVSYCYFHNMQDGLLADPDPTASVVISHSEFADCGTGDGYTHDLYVGSVASLTITDSYFHGAVVGHEIKSRAAVTTIENNVIADGPGGTGSYDIDIPNAGVATITGNLIEKGADASNVYAIHYGGETQYSYVKNSLTVTGNTILNDLPTKSGVAVLNESSVNGLSVSAVFRNNSVYNFLHANLVVGAGTLAGNTMLAKEPAYSTVSPWLALPATAIASGPELLTLTTGGHGITGGAAPLTVNDSAGNNTISGGSGGIAVSAAAGWDTVTTAAGSSNSVTLSGRNSVLYSNGADNIVASGNYEAVTATGQASITGSAFSQYMLDGAGESLVTSCSCGLTLGAAAGAYVVDTGGDTEFSVSAGGSLSAVDAASTPPGGAAASLTVTGGAASGWLHNGGAISVVTGDGGADVAAGAGVVSVSGGAGNDTISAGSGNDIFVLGSGLDQVYLGSGTASVTAGAGADSFIFTAGDDGQDSIAGFTLGIDQLVFNGFAGAAVSAGTIVSGSTLLTLSDGTTIDLVGVVLPAYAGLSPGAGQQGGGGPAATSAGSITLFTSGQSLHGGAALLALTDQAGGNSIAGGAGGLAAKAGDYDALTTQAGSSNRMTLARYDTLSGAGSDQVTVTGYANVISESGTASISLLGGGNAINGGSGQLSVHASIGGDTIIGGSGGLILAAAIGYETVVTQMGAADTVSLGGYASLLSQGTDTLALSGNYNQATVTGNSAISIGTGYDTLDLQGADTLSMAACGAVTVGKSAAVRIIDAGTGDIGISVAGGGSLALTCALPAGEASLSVAGGGATVAASTGAYAGLSATLGGGARLTLGDGAVSVTGGLAEGGPADTVVAGSGNVTLQGGAGAESILGGSGQAVLNLGGGADTVSLGDGAMTVSGGAGDLFVLPDASTGSLTVMNWSSQDSFASASGAAPVFASISENQMGVLLTTAAGAHITLAGVTQFN